MAGQTIPAADISQLVIRSVGGNLHLKGRYQTEIQVREPGDKVQVETRKDRLEMGFPADAVLSIPHDLEVRLESVNGDAVIRGLQSELSIDTVHGDLNLSNLGSVHVKTTSGEILARNIQGDLQVESAGGSVQVMHVQGQVGIKGAGGDLFLEHVSGGIEAAAGGDLIAEFFPVSWQAYQLQTGGDLTTTLPDDCQADLSLESGAGEISILIGGESHRSDQTSLEYTLGEGGTSIQLQAGGRIFISGDDFGILDGLKLNARELGSLTHDFSTQTAEHIRSQLGSLEEDLQGALSGLAESLESIGISEENLKQFGIQIEESSRLAAEKAQLAAIKAQAKVEKRLARARRKAVKATAGTKHFDLNSFLEERSNREAVKQSERMLILEMLQEKKITPEEADQLLKALEGKKA